MHEVRRYDGEGNLIETISSEEVKKKFWADLKVVPEISEEVAKTKPNSGIYHLIAPLQRKGAEKKCACCGGTDVIDPQRFFGNGGPDLRPGDWIRMPSGHIYKINNKHRTHNHNEFLYNTHTSK